MELRKVVEILQVGFSGFAFLMAALSFRLLRAEAAREGAPRRLMLNAIQRYTLYTCLLASLVLLSRFGEDAYRSHLQTREAQALRTAADAALCRDGLSRLTHADLRIATNYDSLLRAVQEDTAACRTILKMLEK